jgi:fructose-bisphosphate aldolase class II
LNVYQPASLSNQLKSDHSISLPHHPPRYTIFISHPKSAKYSIDLQLDFTMGATDALSRKAGVITGDDVLNLFKHAQEHKYAIPAINVTSSSTVVAALEAARDKKSPIILQTSQGGAAYFAGKGVSNDGQAASIAGAVAAAHYIRAISPVYGVPVVLHSDHCAKKLLPWLDGMLDADEKYFKEHGEPLYSSHSQSRDS